jgi:Skp family chaperone for outer membrane proteins
MKVMNSNVPQFTTSSGGDPLCPPFGVIFSAAKNSRQMKNWFTKAALLLSLLCLFAAPQTLQAGTCENCHARINEIENNILPPLKDELAAIKADYDKYSKNAEDEAAAANAATNPVSQAYHLSQQLYWNGKTTEKLTEAEAKQAQIDPYNAELVQLNACSHNEPPPPVTGHWETIETWIVTGSEWVVTGGSWEQGEYLGLDEFDNPVYGPDQWVESGEWQETGYWHIEDVWIEDAV